MIKNYKKLLFIICFLIIILLGIVIFCKKLELTKYIVLYNLTSDDELKKRINDTKIIKETITILGDAKIDNSEWETTTGNKYRLELYDNNNKMISQVFINTNYNNPVHIKYKDYDYSLKLKQIELLNTIIDNYIELNS